MIIACEGIDGAGKNTLVSALEEELIAQEIPVARLSFPRYEHSVTAHLAQRALHREMGDVTDSINGMALLFALDRHEVAEDLASLDEDGYVVLLDRYAASNAAYSVARQSLREESTGSAHNTDTAYSAHNSANAVTENNANTADNTDSSRLSQHPIVAWVEELEFQTLGIPVPDLHILVDIDAQTASERATHRAEQDSTRSKDAYESSAALQQRTLEAYRCLAEDNWCSPWLRVDTTKTDTDTQAQQLAAQIIDYHRNNEG